MRKCCAACRPAGRTTAALAVVAVCGASLLIRGQVAPRDPSWSRSYPSLTPQSGPPESASVALSDNARCVAVAAFGSIEVLDNRGQALWRWDYGKANRFIKPGAEFGYINHNAIAVSSSCNAIAVVGNPGYRYTWIANRRGQRISIHTPSTPLTVAFDRNGEQVAIGTGGGDVLLYATAGQLKWKTTLENWCCVVRQLSFSNDNRSIVVRDWGIGVLGIDGKVAWTSSENGMNAARDLRTFVAWAEPNHGPGIGNVTALDQNGNTLWSRVASSAGGVISSSGDKIVAWINENQSPTEEDGFRSDELKRTLQVLARNGDVITTLPVERAGPMAISPDGNRVLLSTEDGLAVIDLQGHELVKISSPWTGSARAIVADDFSGVLIVRREPELRVQWYKLE
jgi:hypothetical protein